MTWILYFASWGVIYITRVLYFASWRVIILEPGKWKTAGVQGDCSFYSGNLENTSLL